MTGPQNPPQHSHLSSYHPQVHNLKHAYPPCSRSLKMMESFAADNPLYQHNPYLKSDEHSTLKIKLINNTAKTDPGHVKIMKHHEQNGSLLGRFNIRKSINIIHHISRSKQENHMAIWVRNEKAFVKNSSSFSPLSLLSSFTGGVRMTHNPIAKEKFKYGKVKITPKPYHSPPS